MFGKLALLGSVYGNSDPMDSIGQQYQPQGYTWNDFLQNQQANQQPSVAGVMAQEKSKKPSNIPSGVSGKQAAPQVQPNNTSIGILGGEGNWASALTGLTNSFIATKNQKDAEDKQLFGQVIEGLGKGLGGMAMSDRRLKENIRPVGKLNNGLTVYVFNWKGQDTPLLGLIAQEVQKVIPEAVTKGEDGYLRLNYDLATRRK